MKGLLLFTVLILAMIVSIGYSLTLLDTIVHGTLYNYKLEFSYSWAVPYWNILRMIQAFLGLTTAFTLMSMFYVYRRYIHAKPKTQITAAVSEKSIVAPSPVVEPQPLSVSGMFKCPHCGKVFAQPLRMLDFHSDRPRIVNICPFCNEVIPPLPRQELESGKKVFLKGKKNNDQAKVAQELQETKQVPRKDEPKETVTA